MIRPALVIAAIALCLAACGNQRGADEWQRFRDSVNAPFR